LAGDVTLREVFCRMNRDVVVESAAGSGAAAAAAKQKTFFSPSQWASGGAAVR
jgi:hypothetical protein